ncbi:MAG: hypothetical protein ACLQIQ_14490 [Beijerinckiaceae bacterium]
MPEESSTSPNGLKAALDLSAKREQGDLLEGIRLPDRNIDGNVIIVVLL